MTGFNSLIGYALLAIIAVTVAMFAWLVVDAERKVREIRRQRQEDEQ